MRLIEKERLKVVTERGAYVFVVKAPSVVVELCPHGGASEYLPCVRKTARRSVANTIIAVGLMVEKRLGLPSEGRHNVQWLQCFMVRKRNVSINGALGR